MKMSGDIAGEQCGCRGGDDDRLITLNDYMTGSYLATD